MSEPTGQNVPPERPKKQNGGAGAVIGIIIIIILLGLGGVYYFTTGVRQVQDGQPAPELTADEEAAVLSAQGTSTELPDIEADLEATDLSGLDDASLDFESELQAQ